MKKIIIGLLLLAAGVANSTTTGQIFTSAVEKKQCEQQQRIQQGIRSGELTRKEVARLEMQQAKINQCKRIARVDGIVTPYERAIIKHEQRRADRVIAIQKLDGESR